MAGHVLSNSYSFRTNWKCERRGIAARILESASAMAMMTYSEQLVSVALRRSPGPPATTSFQRPGPELLNETIPVVFIGRNRDGFWVVRDAEAKFGGLFWRKQAALDFAKANAAPGGYAAVFPNPTNLFCPDHRKLARSACDSAVTGPYALS